MKTKIKIISSILFFVNLHFVVIAQQGKNIAYNENKLTETKELIAKVEKKTKKNLKIIRLLNSEIRQTNQLISEINDEIKNVSKDILKNEKKINTFSLEKSQLESFYSQFIVALYKKKLTKKFENSSFISNYESFINKYSVSLTRYVINLHQSVNKINDSIVQNTEKLKNQKEQLKDYKNKQNKHISELKKTEKKKKKEINSLKNQKSELKNELKKEENNARFIRDKVKEEVKKEEKNVKNTKSSTKNEKKLTDFELAKTKMKAPIAGILTSTFGSHKHEILDNVTVYNDGIEITASKDPNVKSVFQGKVTKILSIPGAKSTVIVKHGEYFSVYSNLSKVNVKENQNIKKEQIIGSLLIDKNNPENMILNFQIWHKNQKLNPLDWIKI